MRRLMTLLVVLGFAMTTVGCACCAPKPAAPAAKATTAAPATK